MTFADRFHQRWLFSIILFAIGFLVAQGLIWIMMNFIVYVAVQISEDVHRRLLQTVVQILVAGVYLFSWIVRGIQLSANIDVRNASPLQKKILALQLAEEADGEKSYLGAINAIIKAEGVEVKDLVGPRPAEEGK